MTRHHITTSLLMGIVLLIGLVGTASAEIPQVIGYQGRVTDTSGNPVADGNYTMRFRIYDAVTVGTLKWDSGVQTVAVAGGVFSVLLGESPQPALGLDFSQDYWLAVTFSGVDQTPRQRMASSGYAYMASGLVPGTEVSGSLPSAFSAAIKGTNTATSNTTYGVHGQSASTTGRGVFGQTVATTGNTYGVSGESSSDTGTGVHGLALASTGYTYGVHGKASSTGGRGVYGEAPATSGTTYGVYGRSNSTAGTGVYGRAPSTTGTTYGVVGETSTSSGNGVRGVNYATTGYTCAVHGLAMSSAGRAVSGECNGTGGIGVVGWAGATTGPANGVFGYSASPAGAGVVGQAAATTGGAHGVYGTSAASEGRGVTGVATAVSYATAYGVHGINNSAWGAGVYGYSNQGSADGVLGENGAASGNAWGVYGRTASTQGWAVYGFAHATTGSTRGVCGRSDSPSGYGVYYQGGLAGSGTKSCVVRTSKGPSLMYCQESPENWFEDFGEGTLVDGRCHIELDPVFLETVTVDAANPMKVFVTPQDPECEGLAALPLMSGFDVVELRHGVSSGRFTYRVVAKRSGFEAKRLDLCEAALTDSYLYPQLKEKEREEEEARAVRRDHTEAEYQHPHTALMPVSAVAP